jgi:hypothetical protein
VNQSFKFKLDVAGSSLPDAPIRSSRMKLWLDDMRPPWEHGCDGWEWAKTSS